MSSRVFCRGVKYCHMSKLQGEGRTQALSTIPQWKEVDNRDAITRTFMFKGKFNVQVIFNFLTLCVDFKDAFAFMTKTAEYCDPVCKIHQEASVVFLLLSLTERPPS